MPKTIGCRASLRPDPLKASAIELYRVPYLAEKGVDSPQVFAGLTIDEIARIAQTEEPCDSTEIAPWKVLEQSDFFQIEVFESQLQRRRVGLYAIVAPLRVHEHRIGAN
jgi:hypothetical protein